MMGMELWACGFNAWGQLQFAESASRADDDEPEDITTFKRVLSARGSIRIIETSFSALLGMFVLLFSLALFWFVGYGEKPTSESYREKRHQAEANGPQMVHFLLMWTVFPCLTSIHHVQY
jgi:hypothetical protein